MQHNHLLPERRVLRLKLALGLERRCEHREHELDQCDHVASLANSRPPSTPDEVFNTHRHTIARNARSTALEGSVCRKEKTFHTRDRDRSDKFSSEMSTFVDAPI